MVKKLSQKLMGKRRIRFSLGVIGRSFGEEILISYGVYKFAWK